MDVISLTGGVTLYQGDALTVLASLPEASVDAVLTDPPYSSGGLTLGERQQDPTQKYRSTGSKRPFPAMLGDVKDQHSWARWCTFWLAECWRVSRPGAPIMVFTDWRQLPALSDALQAAGWIWRGIVVWDKRVGRPMPGRFRPQCEYILFGTRGRLDAPSKACLPGMYSHVLNHAKKLHLMGKPVPLLEDLLAVTRPDATVLDPFMGSASVGEACVASGRGYLGIELSHEYYALSRERLAAALEAARQAV